MAELESHKTKIQNLLQYYRREDPRLAEIIQTIADDLHNVIVTVKPIEAVVSSTLGDGVTPPGSVETVVVSLLPNNIQIAWSSVGAQFYEIREGTVWETATFILKTASLGAALNPRVTGTYDMLIKSVNAAGIYSAVALAFQIVIPPVTYPPGSIVTTKVVDNNVLLWWPVPISSFNIDYYRLYRESVFYGTIKGNFTVIFELVSNSYDYEIEAVDIAGSTSGKILGQATVRQPPDFQLLDDRILDLQGGSFTNCAYDGDGLVACIDVVEDFQTHFTSKSWSAPSDQVAAGYERFIQENLLTGEYIKDHDYGAIIENAIVNYTYVKEQFTGCSDVTVTFNTYYRDSIINPWLGPLVGDSVFITHFIQMRTKIVFTGANDDAMIRLKDIHVRLDVKRETDSGQVNALASDTDGTQVNFTKTFRDIDSIDHAVEDTTGPITVVIDFVDAPNPTGFKVLCFDSAGRRVDALVHWIAKGIV